LKKLQEQHQGLDSTKLRSQASNYAADWLQIVVNLIDGSTEGNPILNGQTLEEENLDYEVLDWFNYRHESIEIRATKDQMRDWDNKLYGGHQFERMILLFKCIVNQEGLSKISSQEIDEAVVLAVGPKNFMSEYIWAASLIVQRKVERLFEPLVEQMCKRGAFIMKRLADIAFNSVEMRGSGARRAKQSGNSEDFQNQRGYSYFRSIVKDIYNQYVDRIASMCKEKCMNEVLCSQLIYWELNNLNQRSDESTENLLNNLATNLFNDLRVTITNNILLKGHNFFLVQMQQDLSGEVLKEISAFEDKLLEEIFELKKAKEELKAEEEKERMDIQSFQDKELQLRDLSTQFSRFTIK